ncbi:MAG: glycoside hydrolase family 29 [Planctomycetota bacterium]|nr:MAG: glycoside hydrolase family 29 [Planctomycetota bacterium]
MHRRRTRRHFLQAVSAVAAVPMVFRTACRKASAAESCAAEKRPLPTPAQLRWQDYEVGIIFHFDMPIAARAAVPNNATKQTFDPQLYNPTKLDTDQWAEVAKAAGARYAVFTATHFNGFMQWQSDLYPYGVKQAAWRNGKGDVVADFVRSCRKVGIEPGIYLSTHRNAYHTVWGHYVDWGKGKGTAKQERFNRIAEAMTDELTSRYGPLSQIWFDAGVKTPAEGGPDVLPIFERNQPDSIFYHNKDRSDHRWIGNEKGYANDPCWATMPGEGDVSHNADRWRPLLSSGDPDGTVWSPGMVDVPLRGYDGIHDWFWAPDHERGIEPLDRLLAMYYQSVGRNCNFIIGAVISPEGLVPEADARRLAEFGTEIRRRFDRPAVAETRGSGNEFLLLFSEAKTIDHIILQEDIALGERIREFVVDSSGSPSELARGKSVGHKRILRFEPRPLTWIRLRITKQTGVPHLRRFAAFEALDSQDP